MWILIDSSFLWSLLTTVFYCFSETSSRAVKKLSLFWQTLYSHISNLNLSLNKILNNFSDWRNSENSRAHKLENSSAWKQTSLPFSSVSQHCMYWFQTTRTLETHDDPILKCILLIRTVISFWWQNEQYWTTSRPLKQLMAALLQQMATVFVLWDSLDPCSLLHDLLIATSCATVRKATSRSRWHDGVIYSNNYQHAVKPL